MRDEDAKRELLATWLSHHGEHRIEVARAGHPIDTPTVLQQIAGRVREQAGGEWLYILLVDITAPVPAYVGRSTAPTGRWRSHLAELARGTRGYARWRTSLLAPDGSAASDLSLILLPDSAIAFAPIPGFPRTVGSVEYQLVALAGDVYGTLLNAEGNRR